MKHSARRKGDHREKRRVAQNSIPMTYTYIIKEMKRTVDGWMDGWMDGRTDEWMDGWMEEWMDWTEGLIGLR